MRAFTAIVIRVPVAVAAAALIVFDTFAAIAAMIGESKWGQFAAFCFPVAVTILIIAKRPIVLVVLHVVAAAAIIVRNQRLIGYTPLTEYGIFLPPLGLVLILWAWWRWERRLLRGGAR